MLIQNLTTMRSYFIIPIFALYSLLLSTGCKKDQADGSLPTIKLSTNELTGRSDRLIQVTVTMAIPDGFKELQITKGLNLKTDSSYGTNGVLSVTPASTGTDTYQYAFSYLCNLNDVDKLVGFNFKLTDNKGRSVEKDLTLHTMTNPAQTIYSHKWGPVSEIWETGNPPSETIQDCKKKYVYHFNKDSTMSVDLNGSGCNLDALNVYDKWTLGADETTFTIIYHNAFNPAQITTEVYKVISLTNDQLVMTGTLDLSAFGGTDHELFQYTFNAIP